jgi:uncharacterized membrane protein required for colicin V production
MGLDLALGGLVLITAIRGWFRGFVLQAVRLVGLVACVYAADPVRDQAKPYVLPYLPSVKPELVDRGLWWCSAILSYVVLVGLASLALKIYRRKPFGLEEANRNDQIAGALLGLAKGAVVAAFVAAGVQNYALTHLKNIQWVDEQAKSSEVLRWSDRYRPVPRIWSSPPVQHYVNHVRKRGLYAPAEPPAEPPPVQTASRTPKLEWPAADPPPADDRELSEIIDSVEQALRNSGRPN